jgi:hypothetical protein
MIGWKSSLLEIQGCGTFRYGDTCYHVTYNPDNCFLQAAKLSEARLEGRLKDWLRAG